MKRTALLVAATCLALRLGVAWPAAEGPAASRGDGNAPAASRPRSTTPPAAKEDDEDAVPPALIDAARGAFVIVKHYFQKDTSETPEALQQDYRTANLYEEYVDQKRPAETPGLVLDDQGHVLIVDSGLEDRLIQKIEVEADGKTYPAARRKLLFDAPATVLKVEAGGALKPLRFGEVPDKGVNTMLLQASLYQTDDEWRLRFGPIRPSLRLEPAAKENVFFGHRSAMGFEPPYGSRYGGAEQGLYLLADADGVPVGCATAPFFDLRQAECLWRGADLQKADGIEWQRLAEAEKACREKLTEAVHEVVIVLRQGEDAVSESFRTRPPGGMGSAAGREISTYGLAISPTDVLVLQALDSKMARQIERIYLKDSPTRRQDVDFLGACKDIGGFVVRLPSGRLPAAAAAADGDPQRMRPFWMARLRKRLGNKYVDLSTNRLYGRTRGYKGEYPWYAARPIMPGTFLVDFEGRLVGAYVHERREHEEESRLEASRRYRGPSGTYRIFTASELRGLLAEPQAHLDPKIQVQPKTLAKRRAWLGVEFVPMTSGLAEMLKLETPTKDGQLGFLINAVYEGSPAQKMDLKVGDILLGLQAPGMPYPIELASRLVRDRYDYPRRWYGGYGGEEEEEEGGPVEPTWRDRQNFLTRALDAVGVGKTVRLTYFHPTAEGAGEARTVDYAIELAPPDLDSAPKWRNRKLGLTVKDVTYEVRHALNLKPPAGVIVTSVENGSPTIVARIYPNEILTRLDEQSVSSVRQMRDLIAAARKAGRDKVRLTVLRLGKTRFADLSIVEYDPADDEGLDEEELPQQ